MMAKSEDELKLSQYFNAHQIFEKQGRVINLTKIAHGWETEIYSFNFRFESGIVPQKELVLRIYAGDAAEEKSNKEFRVMAKLHGLGFPVPKVYHLEINRSVLGKPFVIMEKVNGKSMAETIEESPIKEKEEMVKLFCKIFVDLHRLDKENFISESSIYDKGTPDRFLNGMLEKGRRMLIPFNENQIKNVLDWLEQEKENVHSWRLSPVHLDYHFHNILIGNNGKPFVIDWTNFDIADYRMDLAWTILLSSSYDHPEARDIILEIYERISGEKVEDIEFFEALAAARRLFSIFISLRMGPERLGMRPEAAELMKRQKGHMRYVSKVLHNHTGINVSELLDEFLNF